jgi:hypothetical protein
VSTQTDSTVTTGKPWYRQFWPWFLIALPAISVVAGLTTLAIAIRNQDSLVRDDWYKDGKAINQSLARDGEATRQGMSAELQIDAMTGEVTVLVSRQRKTSSAPVSPLTLSHPTLAEQDQTPFSPSNRTASYRGVLSMACKGVITLNWALRVAPA